MFANCFSFWRTSSPKPPTGTSPLDPTEEFRPQTPWAMGCSPPNEICWRRHWIDSLRRLIHLPLSFTGVKVHNFEVILDPVALCVAISNCSNLCNIYNKNVKCPWSVCHSYVQFGPQNLERRRYFTYFFQAYISTKDIFVKAAKGKKTDYWKNEKGRG